MRQLAGVVLAISTVGVSFLSLLCFHEKHALLGKAIFLPHLCSETACLREGKGLEIRWEDRHRREGTLFKDRSGPGKERGFCGCKLVASTGEAHFCAPAFSYVLRSKKGPFFVILFCSNFHSLEALKACREACPDVFCSNFHGLATLEFKTCIEACLQLCFIL